MLIAFTLSMPGVASWDGRWSGEGKKYVVVRSFVGKAKIGNIRPHLDRGHFHYNFGDGWAAGVTLQQVSASQARALRARSDGFCGYDWMIDSIIEHGRIQPRREAA